MRHCGQLRVPLMDFLLAYFSLHLPLKKMVDIKGGGRGREGELRLVK